ncbi:hypothetical protein SteCoe_10685 [Stentor coeruleus]|uniref:AttH domain-containing protein n=1 Tax=Stentor coeruleus TaxID=5963 RepID=A0A1R2CF19_9CILI|nr:hypothetical protein SteCoe_10685 [Stentor coeruleus]
MKLWLKLAFSFALLAVCLEIFILTPSPKERLSSNLPQTNLDNTNGKVLTDAGKLSYSGYSKYPSLNWDPSPLTSSFSDKLRYKMWDVYILYTNNLTLLIALADIGYIKNSFIISYEKKSSPKSYEKLIPPWESTLMSSTSLSGTTSYNSSSYSLLFSNLNPHTKSIKISSSDYNIDLIYSKNDNQESIFFFGPFNEDMSQFFYAHKSYNYNVKGNVKIGNNEYILDNELGLMDWGRGVWPYQGKWMWASGNGIFDGKKIALNMEELPKDFKSSKASEDCFFVDDKMIKLGVVNLNQKKGSDKVWEFKTVNVGPNEMFASIKGIFVAEESMVKKTNLWIIKSQIVQYFGEFEGEVETVDGIIRFKVRGLVEYHESRW